MSRSARLVQSSRPARSAALARVLVALVGGSMFFLWVPTAKAYRILSDRDLCEVNGCSTQRIVQRPIPFSYRIHQSGSDDLSLSQVESGFRQQFETWSAPSCTTFDASYAGRTSTRHAMHDGVNVMEWIESSWSSTGASSTTRGRAIFDLVSVNGQWYLAGGTSS